MMIATRLNGAVSTLHGSAIRTASRLGRKRRSSRVSVAGALGAGIILSVVFVAIAAPWLAPYDPAAADITARLTPPAWMDGGSSKHWLGTDALGRDLLSRIIFGARSSLLVAGWALLITSAIGGLTGVVAANSGGWIDQVLMRLVDVQLAFPALLLAITMMSVVPPSLTAVVLVLVISGWVVPCRIIRSRALTLVRRDFVEAAVAGGASPLHIIIRHLLPNVLPTLITISTLLAARFVLMEASLSFLGLGLPPAVPSWGGIMNEGRQYIELAWWIETFSGLAVILLISGLGLLGDWMRDVLDPRLKV